MEWIEQFGPWLPYAVVAIITVIVLICIVCGALLYCRRTRRAAEEEHAARNNPLAFEARGQPEKRDTANHGAVTKGVRLEVSSARPARGTAAHGTPKHLHGCRPARRCECAAPAESDRDCVAYHRIYAMTRTPSPLGRPSGPPGAPLSPCRASRYTPLLSPPAMPWNIVHVTSKCRLHARYDVS